VQWIEGQIRLEEAASITARQIFYQAARDIHKAESALVLLKKDLAKLTAAEPTPVGDVRYENIPPQYQPAYTGLMGDDDT
jgi:hypothetical protein